MKSKAAIPFLDSVARAYTSEFDDLSEFCFVFPNKRSGTFFLRALSRSLENRCIIAPEVISITDFMTKVSGLNVDSRIDLLFRLYKIYCRLRGKDLVSADTGGLLDFDSFRSWGETALSDFSDVDNYNVDADALFKNVRDFREISTNFLNDDQLDVLQRYFGYRPRREDPEGFWKHFEPKKAPGSESPDKIDLKESFIFIWQMMAPLYHSLNDELAADGLATTGGAARKALENIRESGRENLPWKKIVFVGFNALSTCEALIFEALRKLGGFPVDEREAFADFFWDGTGPVLDGDSDAGYFLRLNRRNFPSPEWAERYISLSDVKTLPDTLRVIASPSNAMQAKIAGKCVKEIADSRGEEIIEDARVAVVLPDENLLIPLLYSLPGVVKEVNLTMGYSLKLTSAASFMYHLRRLHIRSRMADGEPSFYHEDLQTFLAHPFSHTLIGSNVIKDIKTYVSEHHLFNVRLSEIAALSQTAAETIDLYSYGTSLTGTIRYLDDLLVRVDAALAGADGGIVKSKIERSNISVYRDALRILQRSAMKHGIDMSFSGVFYMVDKLLAGERVTFEGEPLEGLQVMGLLETRALDFEQLVILSLNDSIMPRRARSRTFIPDALRRGYGLPFANYQENLFSYYFYRMISRARNVSLVYDARAGEGLRTGGESRYLLQLRYLYARDKMNYENYRFLLSDTRSDPTAVEKTPGIMEMLEEFRREGSGRNLSASAVKRYCECPVKFYYEVVAHLKTESEPGEYIDAITQGNIIHETMLALYFPKEMQKRYLEHPLRVDAPAIESIINDRNRILREITRAINREHFHKKYNELDNPIAGAAEMVADNLTDQVIRILKYDKKLAPFELVGAEVGRTLRWNYAEGEAVNMNYAIDRLDIQDPEGGRRYRIVDYKTGGSYVEAAEFDDIFNGTLKAKNIFQLMLYANLFNLDRGSDEDMSMAIYEVDKLEKEGESVPKLEGNAVEGHKSINEAFVSRLNGILSEIFDSGKPFEPTEDPHACAFCNLKDLCSGRV